MTNLQYLEYLASSSYRPADEQNWLNDWDGEEPVPGYPELGMYPEGWGDKPVSDSQPAELRTSRPATRTRVTCDYSRVRASAAVAGSPPEHCLRVDHQVRWVSRRDAEAYCRHFGKRLPHTWEWQYAAQGSDGRSYPWGDEFSPAHVPPLEREREYPASADVDAHISGASPYGPPNPQTLSRPKQTSELGQERIVERENELRTEGCCGVRCAGHGRQHLPMDRRGL